MDGIPALDLWKLVVEVFHCDQNQPDKIETCPAHGRRVKRTPTMHDSSELYHFDNVLSNVRFTQSCTWLRIMKP